MEASQSIPKGIPRSVAEYCTTLSKGELAMQAYLLHFQGGLSNRKIAIRLQVDFATCNRWMRKFKSLVDQGLEETNLPVGRVIAELRADDIATKRAALLAAAESRGENDVHGMRIRREVLRDEGVRLGTDIQRSEHLSIVAQFAMMPSDERRAELRARYTRMRERGLLRDEHYAQPQLATGGASPPSEIPHSSLGPSSIRPTKIEDAPSEDAGAEEDRDGAVNSARR